MLSYEPGERPSAAQLVDIFEILAQNARDTGLRKFCRTTVAEAKAAEPALETGDPLAGTTVDEDLSSAFKIPGNQGGGEPPPQDAPQAAQGGNSGPMGKPTPPDVSGARRTQAKSLAPGNSGPMPVGGGAAVADDAPAADNGSAMKLVVVAIVGLLIVGVLVVGLTLLGGIGAFFATQGGGPSTPIVDNTPPTPPTPPPPQTPDVKLPEGGIIQAKDERTDVTRSPTVLKASFPNGADITINGGVGFKAEWDGKSDFDLGQLAEGSYRTNITPVGKEKIRNKSFDIVGKKKSCSFTFDEASSAWTGGCQ